MSDGSEPQIGTALVEADAFERLRELTRNGYVSLPGDRRSDGSIVLRHPSAPDLVLNADGTIDVPLGQEAKPPVPGQRFGTFWQKTFVLAGVIAGSWLFTLFVATLLLDFFGRP